MRILLTGRNGQVGWELERAFASFGDVVAFDRQNLDLANPDQIVSRVRDTRPDVILNAAAYTAVDQAEQEPELAMAINGSAPGILADQAKRLGALLVHYSTDYVFDGKKASPYTEDDTPNPINIYGKSKLAGERAVRESGCRHLIFRTAWVYSDRGRNFLLSILRLAKEKPELRVVDDQHGAPTWARDIARASLKILEDASQPEGTYHLTAAGDTTWCGFATNIVARRGFLARVVPIKSSEYPMPAARPANSLLSGARLHRVFGFSLREWRMGLDECLATFAGATSDPR
jgi:dTDP-4-dehydrorhamnose reductase